MSAFMMSKHVPANDIERSVIKSVNEYFNELKEGEYIDFGAIIAKAISAALEVNAKLA